MRKTLVVVALLMAVGASAGTITSLDPSTITANSGEYFMTINGTDLGDQLQFDGPAGRIVLDINARDINGNVVGWLPEAIANRAGNYTVTVLGGNSGDSGPAAFRVVGPPKIGRFTLHLPDAVVAIAKGRGAFVKYAVSTSGGEDPRPVVKCDPPSDSFFGVGATTVNCVASNQFGETDKGSFSIFVHDATVPSLQLPGRIVVPADSREGAFVKFDVSASDDVDGPVPVECDAKSGELFKVGITTVSCAATDLSANTAGGAFTIEVVDKESAFTLHVPDPIFAEAESREGAKVDYEVYVTGTTDPRPTISCDPASGSTFPMGTKTVYCRASDSFGKSAEGKFEVTVADTTAPMIASADATPRQVDATGDYVLVNVDAKAFDTVDPMPVCSIAYVFANETISPKDWSLAAAMQVKLNAITTGAENRVYHVVVECSDESRNSSTSDALVTVVSKGGGGAEESASTTARRRSVRP